MEVTIRQIFPLVGPIPVWISWIPPPNSPTDEDVDRKGDDCETGLEAKAEPNTEFDEIDLKYFRRIIIMEVRSVNQFISPYLRSTFLRTVNRGCW